MRSITKQAMTNDYNGGQSRDQQSTINYHQWQQWHHWSLTGELATKTRLGSTRTVHTMGGGGQTEQIRGSREVCCHEVAEHAAMLAAQSLADEWHWRDDWMRCGVGGTGAGRGAMLPWGGGVHCNVGGKSSHQCATLLRGGQTCCSTGGTGADGGATQSPTIMAIVMTMAKRIGMATMALIIPYKNESNDSAQKVQMLSLGKMCCKKQTS